MVVSPDEELLARVRQENISSPEIAKQQLDRQENSWAWCIH